MTTSFPRALPTLLLIGLASGCGGFTLLAGDGSPDSGAPFDTADDTDTDTDTDTDVDADADADAVTDECLGTISVDSSIVYSTEFLEDEGAEAWICAGGKVYANAGGGTFYVESQGEVYLNDGGGTVYAKSGAEVTVNSGGALITYMAGADLSVNTSDVTLIVCNDMYFDASAIPYGGC